MYTQTLKQNKYEFFFIKIIISKILHNPTAYRKLPFYTKPNKYNFKS